MKFKKMPAIAGLLLVFILTFNLNNIKVSAAPLYINARSAVAIDGKSKIVLFEKNAHMVIPMASTTKIMTALVAIKYGNLDKKVEISSRSAAIHGSTVGYRKGEMISEKELLFGLMLRSGNDAAIALAEGISGSVDEFVKLMNEYAGQIGVYDTHFESPHGLDSDNHYSSAYDLAIITAKARENQLFNDIVKAKDIDGKDYGFTRNFHNINKILWQLPNATGVKTGSTGDAGKCLVTSVEIQGNDVIIVVLNSPPRWKETIKIHDYIAKNYSYKSFFKKGDILGEVPVKNVREKAKLVTDEDIIIPIKSGSSYEAKILKPNYEVSAPISKGSAIGNVSIYEDGRKIFSKELQSDNDVQRRGIFKKWKLFK